VGIINARFVQFNTIEEYRKCFVKELVEKDLFFEGYKLHIHKEDFEHACFDYDKEGNYKGRFSLRRACRMLLIKDLCEGRVPYELIWQAYRKKPSLCVLIDVLDTGLYFIPVKSSNGIFLRLATIIAYGDKVEKRIKKQVDQGVLLGGIKDMFGS
jgi:hypothetical protein